MNCISDADRMTILKKIDKMRNQRITSKLKKNTDSESTSKEKTLEGEYFPCVAFTVNPPIG
jgi:hypothetical protein